MSQRRKGRSSVPSSPLLTPVSPGGIPPPMAARRRSASRIRYRRRRSSSSARSIHFDLTNNGSTAALVDEDALVTDTKTVDMTLDNSLPVDYFKADLLAILRALEVPRWRKLHRKNLPQIHLKRLSGALTNCIYKVTYRNFFPLLLRIYGTNVDELIDRDTELMTLARLSQQHIGPTLLGCFKNGRFEEFLNNSAALTKDQLRDRKISRMIARRMKQLHYGVPISPAEVAEGPVVWKLIEKWTAIVDEICKGTTDEEQAAIFLVPWAQYRQLIKNYRNWLYSRYNGDPSSLLKFCHNDTQYGNLLFYNKFDRLPMEDNDDDDDLIAGITQSASSLTLDSSDSTTLVTDLNTSFDRGLVVIDFEYSGQNLPAYDIANHFCEWMYDYTDPDNSFRTNEKKYPTREERLNFLNSYVNYTPGTATPRPGNMGRSSSVVSLKEVELPPKVIRLYNETVLWRAASCIFWSLWGLISKGSLVDRPKEPDADEGAGAGLSRTKTWTEKGALPGEVYQITVEDDTNSRSPSPETPAQEVDDEMLEESTDDSFDHRKYVLGKAGVVIGDLIQLKLASREEITEARQKDIKYIDCDLLQSIGPSIPL